MTAAGAGPATVVLVHGSWHGSWCWEKVIPLLGQRGVAAAAIDLPSCGRDPAALTGLHGDARALRRMLDRTEGPIVVCAHSYGGVPASWAAAGHERVRHLVYLSAFMLDAGESCASVTGGSLPRWCVPRADGTFIIDPAAAAGVLYGDCDARTRRRAVSRLVPQKTSTSTQVLRRAAWRACPSTYVVTTLDRALPPPAQQRLARRAGQRAELASSHSPFFSHPGEVAALLADRALRPPGAGPSAAG